MSGRGVDGDDRLDGDDDWRPTAPLENLKRRAELVGAVRRFFAERGVLEVETPALGAATATDLHLASLATSLSAPLASCAATLSAPLASDAATLSAPAAGGARRLYLQTSPELHMKRLLAAGSGPIWQLCKAFRDGEAGRRHNPEFTMLEWYRPGWDHHRLIGEVDELLRATLPGIVGGGPREQLTYRDAFLTHAGIDPFAADAQTLRSRAAELGVDVGAGSASWSREEWLHLLLAAVVEPRLGRGRPTFLLDFPASEAALARVRDGDPPVAERFEAFVEGVELANGYHELADAREQARRFAADSDARRRDGLPAAPADARLLAALEHGLPDCAGVALGFDRLAMLALGVDSIDQVIAFPIDRA